MAKRYNEHFENSLNGFEWIDPKNFDFNKYTSNSCNENVLNFDLDHPKELRKLHNDYLFAQDEIKTKREMLSDNQLKIADLYNIPI